jgi:hypothetical protein
MGCELRDHQSGKRHIHRKRCRNVVNTAGGVSANADSYYCLTIASGVSNWGAAQAANTASCGANQPTAGKFVTISANRAVAPIILGLSFGNGQISQSAVVQVQ